MEKSIYVFYIYYVVIHREGVAEIYVCCSVGNTYKDHLIIKSGRFHQGISQVYKHILIFLDISSLVSSLSGVN